MNDETITILRRDLEIAVFALKSTLDDIDRLFAGYEQKLASYNDEREALARLEEELNQMTNQEQCQCHLEAGDSPCDVHGEEFTIPRKALEVARCLLVMHVDHIDGKNDVVHYCPTNADFRSALAAVEEALKR